MQIRREGTVYTLYKEKTPIGTARLEEGTVWVEITPAWRRRGYGSYLLKELLRGGNGGLDPKAETRFTAPLPADDAARALAAKFDFRPDGTRLVRRRVPDYTYIY